MPVRPILALHLVAGPACACRASSRGRLSPSPGKIEGEDDVDVDVDVDGVVTDHINRLFKFPQMDFEMAIWEMTSLLIAPKKVFKSIYYHVSTCTCTIRSSRVQLES